MFLLRPILRYLFFSIIFSCISRLLFSPGLLMSIVHLIPLSGWHPLEAPHRSETGERAADVRCERDDPCHGHVHRLAPAHRAAAGSRSDGPTDRRIDGPTEAPTVAPFNSDPNGPLTRRYPDPT